MITLTDAGFVGKSILGGKTAALSDKEHYIAKSQPLSHSVSSHETRSFGIFASWLNSFSSLVIGSVSFWLGY